VHCIIVKSFSLQLITSTYHGWIQSEDNEEKQGL